MKPAQPSPLAFQLLALVIRERGGRDIAKLYERTHGRQISYGSLYTTLRRMEEEGWIKMRKDPQGDGRARLYSVSAPGARVLNNYREVLVRTLGALEGKI